MSAHHPLRRLVTALLVLATFATAAAGMLLRTHVVGIALIAAGALCATCAWYVLGAPVRRRDIARGGETGAVANRLAHPYASKPVEDGLERRT